MAARGRLELSGDPKMNNCPKKKKRKERIKRKSEPVSVFWSSLKWQRRRGGGGGGCDLFR